MADNDLPLVRQALRLARERGYGEVELSVGGVRFHGSLAPHASSMPSHTPRATDQPAEASVKTVDVLSPVVGYVRDADGALVVGNTVAEGQKIAIVSALGLDNDVQSPVHGEVVEVLVSTNEAVGYGQVLARIEVTR